MARVPKPVVFEEDEDLPVRANPDLIGHEHAAATLEAAARSGRLPHAWLLAGPPGIGKATLAYRFARWLLAGGAGRPATPGAPPLHLPPENAVFRRVAAGSHADMFVLRPEAGTGVKALIKIDEVRTVINRLALTPGEGGWRVVLVDGAETMRGESANALLKTLEEPPPRAVLLLTTPAPDRLLPTIRSRCRRLDLAPLDLAETQAVLARQRPEMPAADRARLAAIAEGSPGQALSLAEGEGLALQELVDAVLAGLAGGDRRRWHTVADQVAAKRDGSAFVTFMALLRREISGAVRRAARGDAAAPGWLAIRPLAEWSTLWDSLGRLAAETDVLSLDRKQAVLTALGWLSPPRR
ncbi:DNA polymerase III subunit delta' [Roseomonas sp. AR75]|uniref:DNA polymerase III subunit delta' n=1 Tax=Roseomonas sp. AR75 TaxID=2562311 RepID=UPI001F11441B|nr:DNA polymerase III subunit delta' [Roseomonas sp. AR75]